MENTYFVTITGINNYYGKKPFEIGRIVRLVKESENTYDEEAIFAFLPFIEKIGYVANSTNTVYSGTISAGRLYDKIEDYAYARVMFVTHSSVIALVMDKEDVEECDDEETESAGVNTASDSCAKSKNKKSEKMSHSIGFKIE